MKSEKKKGQNMIKRHTIYNAHQKTFELRIENLTQKQVNEINNFLYELGWKSDDPKKKKKHT